MAALAHAFLISVGVLDFRHSPRSPPMNAYEANKPAHYSPAAVLGLVMRLESFASTSSGSEFEQHE